MNVFFSGLKVNESECGTNKSSENRFAQFACTILQFIPNEPRKKDTHTLNIVLELGNDSQDQPIEDCITPTTQCQQPYELLQLENLQVRKDTAEGIIYVTVDLLS